MSNFNLNDDDVLSMSSSENLLGTPTFKASQFKQLLKDRLDTVWIKAWVGQGAVCDVLRPGHRWQKGKVRIQLEFIPDEPDEPAPGASDAVRSPNQ